MGNWSIIQAPVSNAANVRLSSVSSSMYQQPNAGHHGSHCAHPKPVFKVSHGLNHQLRRCLFHSGDNLGGNIHSNFAVLTKGCIIKHFQGELCQLIKRKKPPAPIINLQGDFNGGDGFRWPPQIRMIITIYWLAIHNYVIRVLPVAVCRV